MAVGTTATAGIAPPSARSSTGDHDHPTQALLNGAPIAAVPLGAVGATNPPGTASGIGGSDRERDRSDRDRDRIANVNVNAIVIVIATPAVIVIASAAGIVAAVSAVNVIATVVVTPLHRTIAGHASPSVDALSLNASPDGLSPGGGLPAGTNLAGLNSLRLNGLGTISTSPAVISPANGSGAPGSNPNDPKLSLIPRQSLVAPSLNMAPSTPHTPTAIGASSYTNRPEKYERERAVSHTPTMTKTATSVKSHVTTLGKKLDRGVG